MWSDWRVYERDGALFASLEPHIEGYSVRVQGREYYYFSPLLIIFKGKHLYWCYDAKKFKRLSTLWIKQWIAGGVRNSFFTVAKERHRQCLRLLLPLLEKQLPNDSPSLINLYKNIRAAAILHTRTFAMSLDAFDDYFSEVFAQALVEKGFKEVVDTPEDWSILLQSAYRSVQMEFQLDILHLIRNAKSIMNAKEIKKLWEKYFWLPMGWSGTAPFHIIDIQKEIEKIKKLTFHQREKKYRALLKYPNQIQRNRKKIIQKYRIPTRWVSIYLSILDRSAALHDERKEIQMRTLFIMDQIRIQASNILKCTTEDLELLKGDELCKALLNKKIPRAHIRERKKGYSICVEGKKIREQEGLEALKIIDKELANTLGGQKELRGMVASKGYAKGRALVTDDPNEAIRTIQGGDILITSMTTPDFVPAMKKAAAVVTNEGGVTSHAAIVSRELGIPCIIGVLQGTRIFKTGDVVEVDAEKGIIRKI